MNTKNNIHSLKSSFGKMQGKDKEIIVFTDIVKSYTLNYSFEYENKRYSGEIHEKDFLPQKVDAFVKCLIGTNKVTVIFYHSNRLLQLIKTAKKQNSINSLNDK